MIKKKYLKKLNRALSGVSEGERERLVEYYAELIDEAVERGKSEEIAVGELKPPKEIADEYIKAEYGGKKPRSVGERLAFPVRFAAGFAAFVVSCASLGIIIGFALGGGASIIAGVFAAVMSIGLFAGGHAGTAFSQIGSGLLAVGIGGLLIAALPFVIKLNAVLWKICLRRGEPGKKTNLRRAGIFAASAAAVVFAGVLVFAVSFGTMGFDYKKLAVTDDIVDVRKELNLDGLDELKLVCENLGITVKPAVGEEAYVVYSEFEADKREFSFQNGVLKIGEGGEGNGYYNNFVQIWKRGVMFSSIASVRQKATLFIPESYLGKIAVEVENGAVSVEGITAVALSVTTVNGAVVVKDVNAETVNLETYNGLIRAINVLGSDFFTKSHNGAVTLEYVSAAETFSAQTANGMISLKRISSGSIKLTTNNGLIKGSVVGNMSDYAITSSVRNGSSNLPNKTDGDKRIIVSTRNGSIKITFVD